MSRCWRVTPSRVLPSTHMTKMTLETPLRSIVVNFLVLRWFLMCRATPDVDLTKNPKSLGKDLAKGAKNALPDVSAVPTREEIIANVTPLSLHSLITLRSIMLCFFLFLWFLFMSDVLFEHVKCLCRHLLGLVRVFFGIWSLCMHSADAGHFASCWVSHEPFLLITTQCSGSIISYSTPSECPFTACLLFTTMIPGMAYSSKHYDGNACSGCTFTFAIIRQSCVVSDMQPTGILCCCIPHCCISNETILA